MTTNNNSLLDGNNKNAIYGAAALSQILGANVNYKLLKSQNATLGIQADQVELSAMEQINQMREQFNENIGKVQYNAVQRGIKTSSGSIQDNLELSSKNLSEDIQTIQKNAKRQANALRGQQAVNNKIAKSSMWGNISQSLFTLALNTSENEY